MQNESFTITWKHKPAYYNPYVIPEIWIDPIPYWRTLTKLGFEYQFDNYYDETGYTDPKIEAQFEEPDTLEGEPLFELYDQYILDKKLEKRRRPWNKVLDTLTDEAILEPNFIEKFAPSQTQHRDILRDSPTAGFRYWDYRVFTYVLINLYKYFRVFFLSYFRSFADFIEYSAAFKDFPFKKTKYILAFTYYTKDYKK